MTGPFDIPIDFDKLEGFTPTIRPLADGLRASTAAECPACAIIEYLDPSDERVSGDFVNKGVATLGHLLHQAWAYQEFGASGKFVGTELEVEVEAAIPWKHGVSHDDVVVYGGEWAGVYEVKTHSDTKPKAPSAANHRQSRFRMRLRELAGLPTPGPMRLVMIGKAGREGGWVRGPWEVTINNEQRAEIDDVLDGIDAFLIRDTYDLRGDDLKQLAKGCTRCFPKPVRQATGGADGLLGRYVAIKREHDEIDAQRGKYAEAKKALKEELDTIREQLDAKVPEGIVIESMSGATATRNRAGTLTIKTPTTQAVAA